MKFIIYIYTLYTYTHSLTQKHTYLHSNRELEIYRNTSKKWETIFLILYIAYCSCIIITVDIMAVQQKTREHYRNKTSNKLLVT